MPSEKLVCTALSPKVTVFEYRAFKGINKVKWGHKGRAS